MDAMIKHMAAGPKDVAELLPLLMKKENALKNEAAVILDKLMAADLRR